MGDTPQFNFNGWDPSDISALAEGRVQDMSESSRAYLVSQDHAPSPLERVGVPLSKAMGGLQTAMVKTPLKIILESMHPGKTAATWQSLGNHFKPLRVGPGGWGDSNSYYQSMDTSPSIEDMYRNVGQKNHHLSDAPGVGKLFYDAPKVNKDGSQPLDMEPWYRPTKGGPLDISETGALETLDPAMFLAGPEETGVQKLLSSAGKSAAWDAAGPSKKALMGAASALNMGMQPGRALMTPVEGGYRAAAQQLQKLPILDKLVPSELQTLADPFSAALRGMGKKLYEAKTLPVEHMGNKFNKRDVNDTLYRVGASSHDTIAPQMNAGLDKLGESADNFAARSNGAPVNMGAAIQDGEAEVARLRAMNTDSATAKANALEGETRGIRSDLQGSPGTPGTPSTIQAPWSRGPLNPRTSVFRGKNPEMGKGNWTLNPNEAMSFAERNGRLQIGELGGIPKDELPNGGYAALFPGNATEGSLKSMPRNTFHMQALPPTLTQTIPNPNYHPGTPDVAPKVFTMGDTIPYKTHWDREAGNSAFKMNNMDASDYAILGNGARREVENTVGRTQGAAAQSLFHDINQERSKILATRDAGTFVKNKGEREAANMVQGTGLGRMGVATSAALGGPTAAAEYAGLDTATRMLGNMGMPIGYYSRKLGETQALDALIKSLQRKNVEENQ